MELGDIRRILIIKPSAFGDVIHTLPLLKGIRDSFPQAHIAWLISPLWAEILLDNPYLDQIIPFPKDSWNKMRRVAKTLREIFSLISQIRQERFQLVIDVQGLLRSSLICLLSGAPYRVGFANAREFSPLFYNLKVPVPDPDIHAVDRYLSLLTLFNRGAETIPIEFYLNVSPTAEQRVESLLNRHQVGRSRRIFLINPGAKWPTKRWPTQYYARLIKAMRDRYEVDLILIGSREDLSLAEEICHYAQIKLPILAGETSLLELIALMRRSSLLITNDSGPMHLANALGLPVVAIFGPTNPRRTGPYWGEYLVVRRQLPCMPCYLKRCPDRHQCLLELEETEVLSAVNQMWERIR